jgi:membrane-bound lytic murein transglycosylase D
MRNTWLLVFWLLGVVPGLGQGQDEVFTLDDLVYSAEQWAQENLDSQALQALQSADQEKVEQAFRELQKQLQGEYVIDLATVRNTVKSILPLLESYEETYPYAIWLKTRVDYFEVADQFRLLIPPPKVEPDQPAPPPINPSPRKEREIWITKLSTRPWPKAAEPYVRQLKPIFTAQKVPPELIWLAEVESSFDPRARSPVGAAGLFQLMPATAKRFGLSTTWPLDQRLKPEPSARAAAQYLQFLHGKFKDWRLALAAYNCGEGTVQGLLKTHRAKTFDEIATRLPAETQLYVPKIEATLLRREGLRLSDLKTPRGEG